MTNSNTSYVSCEELFEMAIDMEKKAAAFYQGLLEKTEDKQSLELLKLLRDQELSHVKVLSDFDLSPYKKEVIQFPPDFHALQVNYDIDSLEYDNIIETAIKLEKKSASMYEHSASMLTGELKELLEGLATFEKAHIEKVRSLKFYY